MFFASLIQNSWAGLCPLINELFASNFNFRWRIRELEGEGKCLKSENIDIRINEIIADGRQDFTRLAEDVCF